MKSGKFESNAVVVNSIDAQNKLALTKDMHSISFYISFAEDGVKLKFFIFFEIVLFLFCISKIKFLTHFERLIVFKI